MEGLYVILLGIVQGLTEFLPVSSSGHLVLLNAIFKVEGNFLFLSVLLHFATLLSVIVVLRKEIWQLIKHPFSSPAIKLYIATIPTVIIVLLFKGVFESAFDGRFLPICFMITAVLLFLTEFLSRRNTKTKDISYKSAIFMGIAQGIAVFPGISRSGATISTGLICNENREKTARFSFLMSIPIIVASLFLEIYEMIKAGNYVMSGGAIGTILGFIFAFVVGMFAIKFMLKVVQKNKLMYFSFYLVVIAIISLFII